MFQNCRNVFFIFTFLMLTGSVAFGASCNSTSCTFDGLINLPLGNATLSINQAGELVVDNIGSSGQDGVVQTQLQSLYMKTSLGTPNFSASILGTSANIRQVGDVGGQSGVEIMLTKMVNFNGSDIRHSIDCSVIQVQGYIIHIYNGNLLVETQNLGADPPLLLYPKEDLDTIACGIWPDGNLYTVFKLGSPQPISLLTSSVNQGPFIGDKVLVTALSPPEPATIQTDIENTFVNTGPMRLTSMEAVPYFFVLQHLSDSDNSDCNHDGQVNVLDTVCIAIKILGL